MIILQGACLSRSEFFEDDEEHVLIFPSASTQAGVDNLKGRVKDLRMNQDRMNRRAILDGLSPLSFTAQQDELFGRRQKGTGQWLLETAELMKWIRVPGESLICQGMPGSGSWTRAVFWVVRDRNTY